MTVYWYSAQQNEVCRRLGGVPCEIITDDGDIRPYTDCYVFPGSKPDYWPNWDDAEIVHASLDFHQDVIRYQNVWQC